MAKGQKTKEPIPVVVEFTEGYEQRFTEAIFKMHERILAKKENAESSTKTA